MFEMLRSLSFLPRRLCARGVRLFSSAPGLTPSDTMTAPLATAASEARKRAQTLRVAARSESPGAIAEVDDASSAADAPVVLDTRGQRLGRKTAMACCTTAGRYQLERVVKQLTERGFKPSMLNRDVVYVDERHAGASGAVFLFAEGTAVFWGTQLDTEADVLSVVESLHTSLAQPELERVHFYVGALPLTGVKDHEIFVQDDGSGREAQRQQRLLAFSYGLSRSVQLGVLERQVDRVIAQTRHLPDDLVSPWYVRVFNNRRREVRLRLHDVFTLRGNVNLHSDLVEAPDLYWDAPELEGAYEQIVDELALNFRVERINKRLDYTNELVELLRTQLQESYSHRLEQIIVALISIEILLALVKH